MDLGRSERSGMSAGDPNYILAPWSDASYVVFILFREINNWVRM